MRTAACLSCPLGLLVMVSCAEPVATGLDEQNANQVVGALHERGISATKQIADSGSQEGTWTVIVDNDDSAHAMEVLRAEELPRHRPVGLVEMLGADPLFPSPSTERARWAAGTAAELERSLQGLAGVISVRVHLAIPPTEPFGMEGESVEPSASVLLRYSTDVPPVAAADVQRLVAGAVPNLTPKAVEVVESAQRRPTAVSNPSLARLGPLTVTRSALAPLRFVALVALATNMAAISLALVLWVRLRKVRRDLFEARRPAPQPAP